MSSSREQQQLQAARRIFEHLAESLDTRFSVRLWDGSTVPLGKDIDPRFFISISGPGVIGSILRRPTLETLLKHYASGALDFQGGDLIEFGEAARSKKSSTRLRGVSKGLLVRNALNLLLTPLDKAQIEH